MGEFNRRGIPAGLRWSPDWGQVMVRTELKFSLLSSPHRVLLAVGLLPRATGYSSCHTLNSVSVPCPLS